MGACQVALTVGVLASPYGIEIFFAAFGFRKTLMGLTLSSVLILCSVTLLKPVDKYMRKVYIDEDIANTSKC